mmetsp:Transcript_8368/g.27903  ORF Transcript_8368/g.27903 Transcript_8368/m.27903 type:complete len:223 (+) Transcript_8368:356-1024(+)
MRLGVPFLSLVAAERVDPVVKNSVEPGNHGQTSIVGKVVQQIQHALAVRPGTKRNAVGFPGEVAKRGEGKGIGDGFGFGGCLFFRFFRFSCVPRFGVVFFVFYFRFFIISSSKPSKRPRVQIQVQVPPSSPLRAVGGENRVWWLAFFVAGAVLGICVAGAVRGTSSASSASTVTGTSTSNVTGTNSSATNSTRVTSSTAQSSPGNRSRLRGSEHAPAVLAYE